MRSSPPIASSSLKPGVVYPRLSLPRLEMLFANGQRVWLYQIGTDWLARCLKDEPGAPQIDLRDMLPADVEVDMMDASDIDRAAILFFELRKRYKTADAFLQDVRELCTTSETRLAA